jgi:hypothetical protein
MGRQEGGRGSGMATDGEGQGSGIGGGRRGRGTGGEVEREPQNQPDRPTNRPNYPPGGGARYGLATPKHNAVKQASERASERASTQANNQTTKRSPGGPVAPKRNFEPRAPVVPRRGPLAPSAEAFRADSQHHATAQPVAPRGARGLDARSPTVRPSHPPTHPSARPSVRTSVGPPIDPPARACVLPSARSPTHPTHMRPSVHSPNPVLRAHGVSPRAWQQQLLAFAVALAVVPRAVPAVALSRGSSEQGAGFDISAEAIATLGPLERRRCRG